MLFVGAIHAEELVGVEIVHDAIERLLYAYGVDTTLTRFVDNLQIYFVPIMNPEGHKVVTDSLDITYRKNKRDNNGNGVFDFTPGDGGDIDGVDLNRNFPFNWELGDSVWSSTSYRGLYQASESEVQAIMRLAQKYRFVEAVFYHSSSSGRYNEWVIYPWNWGGTRSPDYPVISDIAHGLASRLRSLRGGTYQAWYSISRNGNANDWLYSQLGTLPFIIEVDTTTQPEEYRLADVCENQWNGILYLLDRATRSGVVIYVYDSLSRFPLDAFVELLSVDDTILTPRTSDSLFGVYRRLLLPGSYRFVIYKDFYIPETLDIEVNLTGLSCDTVFLTSVVPGISLCGDNPMEPRIYFVGNRVHYESLKRGESLTIYDILGRKVYFSRFIYGVGFFDFNVSSGLYFFKIDYDGKSYITRSVFLR